MKKSVMMPAAMMVLASAVSAVAVKPLGDYSFIRGVCYPGGWRGDPDIVRRDLGYARRLQLNSTRIWLSPRAYQQDATGFIDRLRSYVRVSHSLGISTMPILFNGNSMNPQTLPPDSWPGQEAYVKAVVEALKNEPGLLMWDLMNEPSWNDYHNQASEEEKPKRVAEIKAFLAHFNTYLKSLDPVNATTIGHTFARDIEWCPDVDVFSFHDYLPTRAQVENSYLEAEAIAKKYSKPVLNSEIACVCRANPYDMALEICERHKMGWYVFELMIGGGWSDVHGLVYPDGTVRDPSIIAALYGWHRNRDLNTSIQENPNREGHVQKAMDQLEAALGSTSRGGRGGRGRGPAAPVNTDAVLEAAEYCANLLEAAQMVPMHEPPTARIQFWRSQPPEKRDAEAIRKFAFELGRTLKEWCNML
ncbi:MAG: hypothetical protein KBE04_08120 [Phycisphaerae bacterium]|nr:hypothetical protein [Phycisphaerae bacterium]